MAAKEEVLRANVDTNFDAIRVLTSNDFSRRSRRKSSKNESNDNFELHICLEYSVGLFE